MIEGRRSGGRRHTKNTLWPIVSAQKSMYSKWLVRHFLPYRTITYKNHENDETLYCICDMRNLQYIWMRFFSSTTHTWRFISILSSLLLLFLLLFPFALLSFTRFFALAIRSIVNSSVVVSMYGNKSRLQVGAIYVYADTWRHVDERRQKETDTYTAHILYNMHEEHLAEFKWFLSKNITATTYTESRSLN